MSFKEGGKKRVSSSFAMNILPELFQVVNQSHQKEKSILAQQTKPKHSILHCSPSFQVYFFFSTAIQILFHVLPNFVDMNQGVWLCEQNSRDCSQEGTEADTKKENWVKSFIERNGGKDKRNHWEKHKTNKLVFKKLLSTWCACE